MDAKKMRELFEFEQGCKLMLDSTPGTNTCAAQIEATDAQAALIGMGLLVVKLAEEMKVPAEQVLAWTAVTVMKIGQEVQAQTR